MENYSNALGYGFWCGQKCAERKMAAGIPPLGAGRKTKQEEAQAEQVLAGAALAGQTKQEEQDKWSPLAVGAVVVVSLLGIATMVAIIKKSKK